MPTGNPGKPRIDGSDYVSAFNLMGSYKKAAEYLECEPAAIRMWLRRNGYKIIRQAIKIKEKP